MIKTYLNLIRVHQWYKNVVVFFALFFSGNVFNPHLLLLSILGFFSLSCISSVGYLVNDFMDVKQDRLHPEKRNRPLASGKISNTQALLLGFILLVGGLSLGYFINVAFLYSVLALFLLMQIYTFFLKHIVFADVLTIATLFVIRAISGAFA